MESLPGLNPATQLGRPSLVRYVRPNSMEMRLKVCALQKFGFMVDLYGILFLQVLGVDGAFFPVFELCC